MDSPSARVPAHSVVIGYGSLLRSDDGVGQRAAVIVGEWGVPNLRALARHQLTPELAEDIASARLVVFVDASASPGQDHVEVTELAPAADGAAATHAFSPAALLELARALYDACPRACLVTVPAETFELGESLSLRAEHGLTEALSRIRELVGA